MLPRATADLIRQLKLNFLKSLAITNILQIMIVQIMSILFPVTISRVTYKSRSKRLKDESCPMNRGLKEFRKRMKNVLSVIAIQSELVSRCKIST